MTQVETPLSETSTRDESPLSKGATKINFDLETCESLGVFSENKTDHIDDQPALSNVLLS